MLEALQHSTLCSIYLSYLLTIHPYTWPNGKVCCVQKGEMQLFCKMCSCRKFIEMYEVRWNFQRGKGGGGGLKKIYSMGEVWVFSETAHSLLWAANYGSS